MWITQIRACGVILKERLLIDDGFIVLQFLGLKTQKAQQLPAVLFINKRFLYQSFW
jgi:hypothetical protein